MALGNALRSNEPTSEQLFKALTAAHVKEQERVDKLIDYVTNS